MWLKVDSSKQTGGTPFTMMPDAAGDRGALLMQKVGERKEQLFQMIGQPLAKGVPEDAAAPVGSQLCAEAGFAHATAAEQMDNFAAPQ